MNTAMRVCLERVTAASFVFLLAFACHNPPSSAGVQAHPPRAISPLRASLEPDAIALNPDYRLWRAIRCELPDPFALTQKGIGLGLPLVAVAAAVAKMRAACEGDQRILGADAQALAEAYLADAEASWKRGGSLHHACVSWREECAGAQRLLKTLNTSTEIAVLKSMNLWCSERDAECRAASINIDVPVLGHLID